LPIEFLLLYFEVMGETWGIALRWAWAATFLLGIVCAGPATAQPTADDAAAREYFKAGRAAFGQADYESALVYFRHAYRTSRRSALQYNIGVAADRLHREQEALEAFELYLEEADHPPREHEVRGRIEALRKSIAQEQVTRDSARIARPAIIGGTMSRDVDIGLQMPEYNEPIDQPTENKKKWPWIVAAAAVVVASGVTAGVVHSQRSNQNQPAASGLTVNW
jgi:tetratricopeptide (TPR) repeat protein